MNKKPNTPRSRLKNMLRQLFLRSRERATALRSTGYHCAECGIKQTSAKGKEVRLEVHHEPPIDWDGVLDIIETRVLRSPMIPLCKDCHDKRHAKTS